MRLGDLFRWWQAQLWSLLPRALRQREKPFVAAALVSSAGEEPPTFEVTKWRGREWAPAESLTLEEAGRSRLRDLLRSVRYRTVLRLPAGTILQREINLPIAAESAPEQVVGFEFDRLTPFRADDVFWSSSIVRRDREASRLVLSLLVAPKQLVEAALAELSAAGAVVERLEAPGAHRRQLVLPLCRDGSRGTRVWKRLEAGVFACVACAVIVGPFWRQSTVLSGIEARIAALQTQTAEAGSLQRRIATTAATAKVMGAERKRVGDALQVIAAVTEAFPDDTWVTEFGLRQRRLNLAGQSGSAVQLIARLSEQPAIRNPAFTSPVTRAAAPNADLFSISAELAP